MASAVPAVTAMNCAGCDNNIFSSSATIYGDPDNLSIDEDQLKRPVNPYGRTKLIVEDMLRDWAAVVNINRRATAKVLQFCWGTLIGAERRGPTQCAW